MKKNKGFTLLETLVVSTFIASTLIYLFVQISNIKTNYDITFRYNTIPGLYGGQNIVSYLNNQTYDELKTSLNSVDYIDITDGSQIQNGSSKYYKDLVNKIDAKTIIFTKENTEQLVSILENTTFSEEMKNFIKQIDSGKIDTLYRIIIEYNDNTFATLKIG